MINLCKLCNLPNENPCRNYPNTICIKCFFSEKKRIRSNNYKKQKSGAKEKITIHEWICVLATKNYSCANCFKKDRKNLTIDHVISIFNGGENSVENIQPLCYKCHSVKDGYQKKSFSFIKKWFKKNKRKFRYWLWLLKSKLGLVSINDKEKNNTTRN